MIHPALQSQGNAEGRTPVVLLTGADRLSLDSVAFSLVDSFPSVCSIAYDVRPNEAVESGLDVVRNVAKPQASRGGVRRVRFVRARGVLHELHGQT